MKVTVNRELIDKLNKLVNTPPQKGKYYYLEIDNYERSNTFQAEI